MATTELLQFLQQQEKKILSNPEAQNNILIWGKIKSLMDPNRGRHTANDDSEEVILWNYYTAIRSEEYRNSEYPKEKEIGLTIGRLISSDTGKVCTEETNLKVLHKSSYKFSTPHIEYKIKNGEVQYPEGLSIEEKQEYCLQIVKALDKLIISNQNPCLDGINGPPPTRLPFILQSSSK